MEEELAMLREQMQRRLDQFLNACMLTIGLYMATIPVWSIKAAVTAQSDFIQQIGYSLQPE
jgi:hypothetical protein